MWKRLYVMIAFSAWCNADYKSSDLIGRATFQSLEQLVVHDVTRPSSRARVLGSGARD